MNQESGKRSIIPGSSVLNRIVQFFPLIKFQIVGASMIPTLLPGETVIVAKLSYLIKKPKIGDIVAVRDPRDGRILIKRITKKEGDRYFIQGDNKNHSTDSRVFGMIGRKEIVGKVLVSS